MEILFPIFYRVQRVLFDIFGVFRYSELTFCDEEQKLRRKTTKIPDSSTINAFYFNFCTCLWSIIATGKIFWALISVTREFRSKYELGRLYFCTFCSHFKVRTLEKLSSNGQFSRRNIFKQVYEWNTSNYWSICKPDKFDSNLCKKENVTFTGKSCIGLGFDGPLVCPYRKILGYQSRKVECLSMTETENRTAGDLFCDGPRPSDLRKCSIQCPQKRCVLSPWSQWVMKN